MMGKYKYWPDKMFTYFDIHYKGSQINLFRCASRCGSHFCYAFHFDNGTCDLMSYTAGFGFGHPKPKLQMENSATSKTYTVSYGLKDE
jgi:hypothetical protein